MPLTVGIDSYVSVEEADTYFTGRYGADAWTGATTEDKETVLKTATQHIDRMGLLGTKKDAEQVLEFPRCYSAMVEGEPKEVCDADVLPNVKRAVYEEALALLSGTDDSYHARLQAEGVISERVLDATVTYSGAGASKVRAGLASREAAGYIEPYVRATAAFG